MPGFTLRGRADAPVEDVWKLLFDPSRFPEWWDGMETVDPTGPGSYTYRPTGHPDFPMPQQMRTDRARGTVTISCQVSDIDIGWRLTESGDGTAIEVGVSIPEVEAHRLDTVRASTAASLASLAALAEREDRAPSGQ